MRILALLLSFFCCINLVVAQTGMLENFNDNTLDPNWKSVPTSKFSLNESSAQLAITPLAVGPGWENFEYSFNPVDITGNQTVTLKIKNSTALTLRVDLVDNTGKSTNANPASKTISINGALTTISFDFTNKFTQTGGAIVDKTKISKVVFFINPGGTSYNNTITLDDVAVGDPIASTPGNIVLNQVGYELNGTKTAIFTNSTTTLSSTTFDILSSTNAVVHTGNIVYKGAVAGWTGRYFWELNFSNFQTAGIYKIRVGTKISYPFEIGQNILFTKTAFSVIDFFKGMRSTDNADKTLSFNGLRNDKVNVYGGWRDATGDAGKHMSHLSYANNFNPQQIPFVVWSLLKSYEISTSSFNAKATDLLNESKWGADYLLRNIDKQENYLYLSIFDDWGNNPGSREICEWGQAGIGNDGARTANYKAAMREGTGIAIAALARAYRMNLNGDSTKNQYLNGAVRLYNHIKSPGIGYATKNLEYCNDHTENIIDFYCGLLATIELYKATNSATYLADASAYADKIISMLDPQGWFRSDVAGNRPFYHAADEGLPLISLMEYMDIDASKNTAIIQVINKNIAWYMNISKEVNNPFNYMREYYKPYANGALGTAKKAFFLPHDNETGYWWQGENARLASMSTALLMAGRKLNSQFVMGTDSLSTYSLAQLDWILGKNPFDVCMMTGAGTTTYQNYPVSAAIPNVIGGICNGISSKNLEETNIDWMSYPTSDWQNWRWIEQWLPHDAWYLLAVSSINVSNTTPSIPLTASFTSNKNSVCSSANVIFTNTSQGTVSTYSWNFGIGASTLTATTAGSHTISWSSAGTKTITLTITGPAGTSTSTSTIVVTTLPTPAETITGPATTCANSTSVTYSIPNIATATGYTWTLPTGASITNGANTNSITVSFATAGGSIQVTPINSCGNGTASSKTVALTTIPPAAVTITGPATTCANSTSVTYSIPNIATATGYTWTLPTGASITNGANTNSITVSFATAGGSIQVTPTNSCGNGTASSATVAIKTAPSDAGTITGLATTCANNSGVSYSIPAISTATGYTWTIPTGASITNGANTNSITVSFATAGGNIQVTPTNSCGNGTASSKTVALTALPSDAGTITGLATTCANNSGVSYSISAISTATGYTWTIPTGASITNGANTNSITVSFATAGGNIQVTPTNSCGNGTASSATVAIKTAPSDAGTITGSATTCANNSGVSYSIPAISTATGYTWTLPTGASITNGVNTNSITVSFATNGGSIQVTPINSCGNGIASSTTVAITTVPSDAGTITGLPTTCANSSGITYSIPSIATATGYTWILPTGASITNGANTNSITVSFATTGGNIQVTPTNSCGNGTASSATVAIKTAPSDAGTITGSATTCSNNSGVSYSIPAISTATGYTWTLPTGATITNGINTNNITVSFATAGGNIQVTPTNSCGNGNSKSKTITLTPLPTAAGSITGPANSCANSSGITYSIPSIATATGYTWTLPTGATITNGVNTNSITVSFATAGGNIQVTPTNSCGNGNSKSKIITLTPLPTAAGSITGPANSCANNTGLTYSIPNITNASVYNWLLPTGATITNGTNTNTITVSFATTGGSIEVTPTNACGNGSSSNTIVAVTNIPTAAGSISGITSICPNSTDVTYFIPNISTATSYAWELPTGTTITAGANSNSITVSFSTTGGAIQVTPNNSCGNGNSSSKSITIIPIGTAPCVVPNTSTITGPSSISPNQQNVSFSVTNNNGSTYNWTVPNGATIINGQGTNSILVSFGSTGGEVTVKESNAFGSATTISKTVSMTSTGVSIASSINLSLYPNPTSQFSIISVNITKEINIHVSIIDMHGRVISENNWNSDKELFIGEEIPAGIYIVQLKIENQVITKRWIKI